MQPESHSAELARQVVALLRECREEMGMSKRCLAEATGVSRTAIILIERHERGPSLEMVLRLCEGLRTPLAEILRKAEERISRK